MGVQHIPYPIEIVKHRFVQSWGIAEEFLASEETHVLLDDGVFGDYGKLRLFIIFSLLKYWIVVFLIVLLFQSLRMLFLFLFATLLLLRIFVLVPIIIL